MGNVNFEYKELNNNEIEITHVRNSDSTIVIPETLNGKKVVSIGAYSYYEGKAEKIVIPRTVREIGERAFCSCSNLKKVEILSTDLKVGYDLFNYSATIETLDLRNIRKISGFYNMNISSLPKLKTIITGKIVPPNLCKSIISYAIEHRRDDIIEKKYVENLDKKTIGNLMQKAMDSGESEIIQKLIVYYNRDREKELSMI